MIELQELEFSNWFSYGEDVQKISLNKNKLTQILGKNGFGKSSIPLIIEEVLYSKNSKGIKKTDITNRLTKSDVRSAKLLFKINSDQYEINLRRTKTTTKITLLKNGEDISSHTATNTYKTIEKLLGIDFKTFTQLVYQSSKSSLEFLTATDTARKNFLVGLLGLEKYGELYELYKSLVKEHSKLVSELNGVINTIASWISQHETLDKPVDLKPTVEVHSTEELAELKLQLKNIKEINNKRQQNNTYKELLQQLDLSILEQEIEEVVVDLKRRDELVTEKKVKENEKERIITKGKKLAALTSPICPTCQQDIDSDFRDGLLQEWRLRVEDITKEIKIIEEELAEITKLISKQMEIEYLKKKQQEVSTEFERLSILIDNNLESELLSETELLRSISDLTRKIAETQKLAKEVEEYNLKAEAHNSKIRLIKEQLEQYKKQLKDETAKLNAAKNTLTNYELLKKAFSSKGLIGYKIESLVKELEDEINYYLAELSQGRFQLEFKLVADKLNVVILDNDNEVNITALSSGELARVNIATLLAIRKLMSNISSTKLNLLFLDEIMGVLDEVGKEKLIELLLNEEELNTFLVSHEYSHPLLEKISITKEGGISKIG